MTDVAERRGQPPSFTGRPLPERIEPGSEQWLQTMSASKVAAVVGLSPYESRYSIWMQMAYGRPDGDAPNEVQSRGHFLEPAIAAWFAARHPEYALRKTNTWANNERPWQTADPDRILMPQTDTVGPALLEIKSANSGDEWGKPGTNQIPRPYLAQVYWQMDTIGLSRCYVAVLGPFLEFAEYIVDYDPDEAAWLRGEAAAFMDTLPGGPNEQRPDIDGMDVTYEMVRREHPGIIRDTVHEVDREFADEYLDAVATAKWAAEQKTRVTAQLMSRMGESHKAVVGKTVIASRQPGKREGAPPFLRANLRAKLPAENGKISPQQEEK